MKVYELISYLQTFHPDADVKFQVSEEFTTEVDVVTRVFFTDDYGHDVETEKQGVDVFYDRVFTDVEEVNADADEVVLSLEG